MLILMLCFFLLFLSFCNIGGKMSIWRRFIYFKNRKLNLFFLFVFIVFCMVLVIFLFDIGVYLEILFIYGLIELILICDDL